MKKLFGIAVFASGFILFGSMGRADGFSWASMDTGGAPDIHMMDAFSVWTGSEWLVMGNDPMHPSRNKGARYSPSLNIWAGMGTSGAPNIMSWDSFSLWTGSRWLLAGRDMDGFTGALYDPAEDSWMAMNMTGAPDLMMMEAKSVWTGSQWLLMDESQTNPSENAGGLYDPAADSWTAMSMTGAPDVMMMDAQSAWTGVHWLLLGDSRGPVPERVGGLYDPSENVWTAMNMNDGPADLMLGTAKSVWTGSQWLLMGDSGPGMGKVGGLYDPSENAWTAMDMTEAPDVNLWGAFSVWTGTEWILAGDGMSGPAGGRYDPLSNTWTAMDMADAPDFMDAESVWTGAEWLVFKSQSPGIAGALYDPQTDSWTAMNTTGAPDVELSNYISVWTSSTLLVFGKDAANERIGGRYSKEPAQYMLTVKRGVGGGAYTAGTVVTITAESPPPRKPFDAWKGDAEVVSDASAPTTTITMPAKNISVYASYYPGAWTPIMATPDEDMDLMMALSVWTGSEMLLLSSDPMHPDIKKGMIYDPAVDSWTMMNMIDGPADLTLGTAKSVWTGSQWLLMGDSQSLPEKVGGLFDPSENVWTAMDMNGAPSVMMMNAKSVWTGSQWLLMGDSGPGMGKVGGLYDPVTGSWTAMNMTGAPDVRFDMMMDAKSVWTGSQWLLMGDSQSLPGERSGAGYDPVTDTWTEMNVTGLPEMELWAARTMWTGSQWILLGSGPYGITGGIYDASANSWRAINTDGAPDLMSLLFSVWTGSEWILMGGDMMSGKAGARYVLDMDRWSAINTQDAPDVQDMDVFSVWTGSEVLVFGTSSDMMTNNGAAYDPEGDIWTPMSTADQPNIHLGSMSGGVALWTGDKLLVWGSSRDLPGEQAGGLYSLTIPRDGVIPDEWLIRYYGAPENAPETSVRGWPLLWDYIAGTDPTDPESRFELHDVMAAQDNIRMHVSSLTGRIYWIEARDNLQTGEWSVVGEGRPGVDGDLMFEFPVEALRGFYRVKVRMED